MVRICAWCTKDMGAKEPLDDTSVTHGMCPECANEWLNDRPSAITKNDLKEAELELRRQ